MQEYLGDGTYSFEKDFFPIIQNVYNNQQLEVLHNPESVYEEYLGFVANEQR